MPRFAHLLIAGPLLLCGSVVAFVLTSQAEEGRAPPHIDPAGWGSDHVGKPLPAYVTGDECLFCHRKIGSDWGDNRHQLTIRPAEPDDPAVGALRRLAGGGELAAETRYLMGSKRITRFLKRSSEYGKLELLSTTFVPDDADKDDGGKLAHTDSPQWNRQTFGQRCAGCHTTAVDSRTRAFSAVSLDCMTCHGDVDLQHTKDVGRVLLSSKNREPRQIVSLCGQCHLRGGKSKSTGLPYPNTFVAGDNLFRDFQVDFSEEAIQSRSALDQHIWLSVRDVAVFDRGEMNCLACHDVHRQSTKKHQQLASATICSSCHVPGSDNTRLRDALSPPERHRTHSAVCDY